MDPSQIDVLINIGDVELLFQLYRVRHALGRATNQYLIDSLQQNLGYLTDMYGLKLEEQTFESFISAYDKLYNELYTLPTSGDYIIVGYNQHIPYSFDVFIRLLLRSTLRGIRVIPRVFEDDLGIRVELPIGPSRPSSFCIQKLDSRSFRCLYFPIENEDYDDVDDYINVYRIEEGEARYIDMTLETYKEELSRPLEAFEEFFNPLRLRELFDNFFVNGVSDLPLLTEQQGSCIQEITWAIALQESHLCVPGLDENGEYIDFSFLGVKLHPGRIHVTLQYITDNYLRTEEYDSDYNAEFFNTLSADEQVAYVAFLFYNTELMVGHVNLRLNIRYGAANIENGTLVVTENYLQTKVLSEERKGGLVFSVI